MTISRKEPAFADTLRLILPTEDQTELLRACLLSGEPGRRSWEVWCERVGDPKRVFEDDETGLKGLLPLVLAALQRNKINCNRTLLTYLRVASLHEKLRSKLYRDICGRVLSALTAAEVPFIALKACAMADTVYETPAVRHCHAFDLLLYDDDLACATEILKAQEVSLAKVQLNPGPHHLSYQHRFGLPVELHSRLFCIPCH